MDKYIKLLKEKGILEAKVIKSDMIVTAPWVRFKCQYGCSNYDTSWCCPPRTPNDVQMQAIISSYKTAILFYTMDITVPTKVAQEVAGSMFMDGYYKVIALGSGPCRRCKDFKKCVVHACRQPEKAIPSMEACGIDVFQTARNSGFEIKTLRGMEEAGRYFSLILVE